MPGRRVHKSFNPQVFLSRTGRGKRALEYNDGQIIFAQGGPGHAVFYVQRGKVKLTVISHQGKEAVVAMLGPGDFFGEGCLVGENTRVATATAMGECAVLEIARDAMTNILRQEHAISELFLKYLLTRNIRITEDLVDQLFNSSEKRLARVLLLLSRFGKDESSDAIVPKITHETLAEMVGTTRARITFFMNKFRKLGLIDYNGEVRVHSSLLHVVLHD
jgi:CRP/FNR family transcriptional regulator, cyclic AMP receptor protein